MEQKSLLDRLISEKVFYKSVIALIIAMPVVELLTEVMFRLGLDTIPSSMEPYVLLLFGLFGTMLTLVYYVTAVSQKKKFRTADLFYFTLIFFMVISIFTGTLWGRRLLELINANVWLRFLYQYNGVTWFLKNMLGALL